MIHFNDLTPAEAERLAILSEECAEVIQIIGKIQRHGYNSTHPDVGPSNSILLATEIGHVKAAVEMMKCAGDLVALAISRSEETKTLVYRAKKYLHHQ